MSMRPESVPARGWRGDLRDLVRRRRPWGVLSAILLCLAVLAMLDGLVALMRQGSWHMDLLPGQEEALSGPVATANPVAGDLRLRLDPEDAPLSFRLEGFFASYWFGNGMWRGAIAAAPGAAPGRYAVSVGFRGGGGSQTYDVSIWEDADARRLGSPSILRSVLDLHPFHTAGILLALGAGSGLFAWILARRAFRILSDRGLVDIFRVERDEGAAKPTWRVWCVPSRKFPETPDRRSSRMRHAVVCLDEDRILGHAVFVGRKGICAAFDLVAADDERPRPGHHALAMTAEPEHAVREAAAERPDARDAGN